jgi:DNA-binding MarR family transcriptional regulator
MSAIDSRFNKDIEGVIMAEMVPGMAVERRQEEKDEETDSIEQKTYRALIRTASRLEAELNRVFRPHELTGATYNILRVLEGAGDEGRSCGDIAERLIAEVPDMTRLLDRLERVGYVARERSKVDRRMVKVTITDRGLEVLKTLKEPVATFHRRQFGHLSEDKLHSLVDLLAEARGEH